MGYNIHKHGMPTLGDCAECGFSMYNSNLVNECPICEEKVCDKCYNVQRMCTECHADLRTTLSRSCYGNRICKTCYCEYGGVCITCGATVEEERERYERFRELYNKEN